jgi:hypothetical protein
MNTQINTDVLGEIISFLNITEDKSILDIHKQLFNLSDNEKDQILRTWENNSKYEIKDRINRKEWFVNSRLHREADLPAVEYINGKKYWYVNGQRHRESDKPAVEYADGYKEWWINDRRHRDGDLPAVERVNGYKSWFVNGKLHREADKPAVEYTNGNKQWWVNGIKIR